MLLKKLNMSKGFTLIEMIVAMAAVTIIMGTITSMVTYANKAYYKAQDTETVLSGVNSVTETVRELTFNATEAEITEVTELPEVDEDYTYVCCIDNTIYRDGVPMQTAAGLGLAELTLDFSADSGSKMLQYTVSANKADGTSALEPQSIEVYLNNCTSGVEGTSGNCIVFKNE